MISNCSKSKCMGMGAPVMSSGRQPKIISGFIENCLLWSTKSIGGFLTRISSTERFFKTDPDFYYNCIIDDESSVGLYEFDGYSP